MPAKATASATSQPKIFSTSIFSSASRQVPHVTTTASKEKCRSIPRICEKTMTSLRTIFPCAPSFALAR